MLIKQTHINDAIDKLKSEYDKRPGVKPKLPLKKNGFYSVETFRRATTIMCGENTINWIQKLKLPQMKHGETKEKYVVDAIKKLDANTGLLVYYETYMPMVCGRDTISHCVAVKGELDVEKKIQYFVYDSMMGMRILKGSHSVRLPLHWYTPLFGGTQQMFTVDLRCKTN